MAKIDRELDYILKEVNQDNPIQRTPIPRMLSQIRPGNILIFKYILEDDIGTPYYRMAIVVKNDLNTISYISLRNNLLLSTFRLNDAPGYVINFIMSSLYNNKKLCSRKLIIDGLVSLIGKINYRTYKLNSMSDLQKLEVVKSKLPEIEEE